MIYEKKKRAWRIIFFKAKKCRFDSLDRSQDDEGDDETDEGHCVANLRNKLDGREVRLQKETIIITVRNIKAKTSLLLRLNIEIKILFTITYFQHVKPRQWHVKIESIPKILAQPVFLHCPAACFYWWVFVPFFKGAQGITSTAICGYLSLWDVSVRACSYDLSYNNDYGATTGVLSYNRCGDFDCPRLFPTSVIWCVQHDPETGENWQVFVCF